MSCYCSKCDKFTDFRIHQTNETFHVKGEPVEVLSSVAVCVECGDQNFHEELDSQNLQKAFNAYREKHKLLTSEHIVSIRKKYVLSQRSLSKLLGWGDITIHRYESGSIQDHAHNQVLQMIEDPKNMKILFEQNQSNLHEIVRDRLRKRIAQLISEDTDYLNPEGILETYLSRNQEISEYSGFVKFDLEKLINMTVYILNKAEGVFETKLNKLLWYADFLFFKQHSMSMSGCLYVHLPHGPCPDNYELIFALAYNNKYLLKDEIIFPTGDSGTVYKALVSADLSFFSFEELRTLDFVVEYFKAYNAGKIRKVSHDEQGYRETINSAPISYAYAKSLSISLPVKKD